MPNFASTRTSNRSSFTDRKRRAIVVEHESLGILFTQTINPLFVSPGVAQRLGLETGDDALLKGVSKHNSGDRSRQTIAWCREILTKSPLALRCLKAAMNADCDGQAGLQELAGSATMLFYMTEEGQEGRNAFLEKRKPRFDQFPKRP